ncbi:hypothetical protein [Pantoea sp. CTOTU46764]|uniref:hypothetical protein n=1 Tax=Pantoea sp. CTOTU46764 TaxID=2953854 RepID=UPI0028A081B6|nr:hypothetical protein [Pantoea sp. CTOTU46764]
MTTNFSKMTREQLDAIQLQLSEAKKQLDQIDEMKNEVQALADKYGKSLNELLSIVGGGTKTSVKKEDKKYSVQLDGKTLSTSSKQLTKAIKDTEEYKKLQEEYKVLDTFLRAYSTEYSQDYPFNAIYEGNQFYLGMKGTMNAVTKKYYAQYLADNAFTDSADTKQAFKKLVSQ